MTLVLNPVDIVAEAERSGAPGLLGCHEAWRRVPLADVADVRNGFAFKAGLFNHHGHGMPLIRIRDVGRLASDTYYSGEYEEGYTVRAGDMVVGMDGDFRVAVWRGPEALLNQRVCKISVRDPDVYDPGFLLHVLQGYLDAIWARTSSVTVKHLSSRSVQQIPLPLPPVGEQRRIVEALEDRLSRLDAAVREIENARLKTRSLRKAILLTLVPEDPPASWSVTTTGEAGVIELGRQRHPARHHGPEMRPYLRVANVFENRIDTADVKEMDFSGVFAKYRLEPGDVLLNEGQSPHLVGRPAIYRGVPENVAFTNSLLRFRARPDVLPEWALLVFRRHMHSLRFMREARITTNIAHLSAKRLATVEFPVPPLDEQKRLVGVCDELMSGADALDGAVRSGLNRAAHLRRSLLASAVSGRLVPRDPADEPAPELPARMGDGHRAVTRGRRRAAATAPRSIPVPQELPL
ncbi:restriction endonuclease subunit S [Pseudofrankia sp. BMG5.37]|uniref:restriction endonuclease subunit S n=1 Tax=Pseudofrankia sp. BMG5.37 TaxID=3050035 RepID=UPI002895D9BA|nr:restriction endonuclease subunit S [Pseudofrankia sp. BMG5.37]MDT3438083.1 restriction endonuclease subunit S [Pseudofrankia sp. BMG5.37]